MADDEITEIPTAKEKRRNIIQTIENVEDEIDAGEEGEEPTDEQLAKLRRVAEPIPLRAWYVFWWR
jgi:hypothetical protein